MFSLSIPWWNNYKAALYHLQFLTWCCLSLSWKSCSICLINSLFDFYIFTSEEDSFGNNNYRFYHTFANTFFIWTLHWAKTLDKVASFDNLDVSNSFWTLRLSLSLKPNYVSNKAYRSAVPNLFRTPEQKERKLVYPLVSCVGILWYFH